MFLKRISAVTGIEHTKFINMLEEEYHLAYEEWMAGKLLQDAFPTLSPEEREFINTGITEEEWDTMFADIKEDPEY